MAQHSFSFPAAASGRNISVYNEAGDVVATDTLGTSSDFVIFETDLPWGQFYTAKTTGNGTEYTAQGEVQEVSGGGVAADETAYFVATGPVYATNGNGGDHLDFVADDRHGDLPAWASVVDGDPTLSDDAGTVAINAAATLTMDFSAASAIPGADGGIGVGGLVISNNGDDVINASETTTPGDGEDVQEPNPLRGFGTTGPGTLTVDVFPLASEVLDDLGTMIPDGTATPRVALTVTRIAQAAVLPA